MGLKVDGCQTLILLRAEDHTSHNGSEETETDLREREEWVRDTVQCDLGCRLEKSSSEMKVRVTREGKPFYI